MRLQSTMLRFARLMDAMEQDCGPSEYPTTLTIIAPRWYQCLTRGFAWEREWVGAIK